MALNDDNPYKLGKEEEEDLGEVEQEGGGQAEPE